MQYRQRSGNFQSTSCNSTHLQINFCYNLTVVKDVARPNQNQKGFSSILIAIILIVLFVFLGVFYLIYGVLLANKKANNIVETPQKKISLVDKTNPDWKMIYCNEELAKLPGAPFTIKERVGPTRTGPSLYIRSKFPESAKFSEFATCSFSYRFDEKAAYASMGVTYEFDIKNANEFSDSVAEAFASSVNSSWKRLPRVPRKDSGTPFYVTDSLPLVFTRQNQDIGTTEYLDVFFGVEFYVKLTVHEDKVN